PLLLVTGRNPIPSLVKTMLFDPTTTEAVAGRLGSYYAVGTSSDTRGFYFSYPIQEKAEILGVIVVKVDIADIEAQLTGLAKSGQYELAISGDDQVIFVASIESWRLKSLVPLDDNSQQIIYKSRRYANRIISALTLKPPYAPLSIQKKHRSIKFPMTAAKHSI
ncbi:MAG: hypothetical protein LRY40_05890, partial [Shewanella fodinae]|nr:hypothetical protein [Shewanella fodinae]